MLTCAVVDSRDGEAAKDGEEDLDRQHNTMMWKDGLQTHAITAQMSSGPRLLTTRARQ